MPGMDTDDTLASLAWGLIRDCIFRRRPLQFLPTLTYRHKQPVNYR